MTQQKIPPAEQQVVFGQQPGYTSIDRSDEVDIGALFSVLWRGRYLVIGAVVIFTILAIAYVKLIAVSLYEVEIPVYPTSAAELRLVQPSWIEDEDELANYNAPVFDRAIMFREMKDRLSSIGWQKKYWLQISGETDGNRIIWQKSTEFLEFSESFSWLSANEKKMLDDRVKLQSSNPESSAELFTQYSKYIEAGLIKELVAEQIDIVALSSGLLTEEIARRKTETEYMMDDKLIKISEALDVAKALGFKKPQLKQITDVTSSLANTRYLMGSDALSAELKAIQARRNNDAYVKGLRELQSKKLVLEKYLERLERNASKMSVIAYSEHIDFPARPSKPNKLLIVVLAVVLGGMFGVFAVFIRHAVNSSDKNAED